MTKDVFCRDFSSPEVFLTFFVAITTALYYKSVVAGVISAPITLGAVLIIKYIILQYLETGRSESNEMACFE